MTFKDKGPWSAVITEINGKRCVRLYSDDFTHDVALTVGGDFATIDDKLEYATELANFLNERTKLCV